MTTELSAWFNSSIETKEVADEAISQPFFEGEDTSDPSASGPEIFRNPKNSALATASILAYCSAQSGFHPSSQTISEAGRTYDSFVNKISTFPGFTLNFSRASKAHGISPDIDIFVKELLALYRDDVDEKKAIASMRRMANTAKSQSHLDESNTSFLEIIIHTSSNKSTVTVGRTVLRMKKNILGQKTYIPDQELSVSLSSFSTNATYLSAYADTLALGISKETVENWVRDSSSPTNSLTNTCFDKR